MTGRAVVGERDSGRLGAAALTTSRWAVIVAMVAVPASTALTSTALGVFLIALLASGQAARVIRDAWRQPFGKAILLFFAVVLLGTLHGPAPWPDRWDSVWSWRKVLYAFLLLGLFGEAVWKNRFLQVVAVCYGIGVLASFAGWFGWFPPRPNREIGVLLQNHTTQGMAFAIGLLVCAQKTIQSTGRIRQAWGAGAALLAANILFVSPGRSTWLVVAAMLVVLGLQRFGLRRIPAVLAGVAALCLAAYELSPLVHSRVDLAVHEAIHADESDILTSVGFRAVVYRNTAELIAARPVLGYGTGSFRHVYSPHVAARYGDWRGEPTADPHSQYMLIAMETGLVGLGAFLIMLVTALRTVRRGTMHAWIGAAALAGWAVSSVFNSHFRTFPESHLIVLLLGTMLAAPVAAPGRAGDA